MNLEAQYLKRLYAEYAQVNILLLHSVSAQPISATHSVNVMQFSNLIQGNGDGTRDNNFLSFTVGDSLRSPSMKALVGNLPSCRTSLIEFQRCSRNVTVMVNSSSDLNRGFKQDNKY